MIDVYEFNNTQEITCPFCGHEHNDSWDLNCDHNDDHECESCGQEFVWERNISVDYSSRKPKLQPNLQPDEDGAYSQLFDGFKSEKELGDAVQTSVDRLTKLFPKENEENGK